MLSQKLVFLILLISLLNKVFAFSDSKLEENPCVLDHEAFMIEISHFKVLGEKVMPSIKSQLQQIEANCKDFP